VIRTPRLDLRPLADGEADAILAGNRAGRSWSAGYPTSGDVETASWPAPTDARWRTLQAIERASGLAIGGIGCHGAPSEGIVEIGYGFAPEVRGRGLATEALAALVHFLEAQPEVRVVRAATDADNVPSQRVLERCGFVAVARDELAIAWRRERP
jgi:RimJ/RimL family protein N-acetyltransferase